MTQDSPASSEARKSRSSASEACSLGSVRSDGTKRSGGTGVPSDRTFLSMRGEHVAEGRLVVRLEGRHQLLVELVERGDLVVLELELAFAEDADDHDALAVVRG